MPSIRDVNDSESDSESGRAAGSTPKQRRPLPDEWGIYDPEQAGLRAVIRRVLANDDDTGESPADPKDPAPR